MGWYGGDWVGNDDNEEAEEEWEEEPFYMTPRQRQPVPRMDRLWRFMNRRKMREFLLCLCYPDHQKVENDINKYELRRGRHARKACLEASLFLQRQGYEKAGDCFYLIGCSGQTPQ